MGGGCGGLGPEHPPETTAASPMVEVFIRYGLNVVRGGRQQSKMASVEQKQLEEQVAEH